MIVIVLEFLLSLWFRSSSTNVIAMSDPKLTKIPRPSATQPPSKLKVSSNFLCQNWNLECVINLVGGASTCRWRLNV